jgi:hypothetical protein
MGSTGSPYNLPYPEEGDFADVPVDMRALADAVARELGKMATTTVASAVQTALDAVKGAGWTSGMTLSAVWARVVGNANSLENLRPRNGSGSIYGSAIRAGSTSGTTTSSGGLTIPHGLGKVPTVVLAEVNDVPNGKNWICQIKARDATTIGVDLHDVGTNAGVGNTATRVDWIVLG